MNLETPVREEEAGRPASADAQPYPPASQGWYCVFVLALALMINFLDRGILNLLVEPIKRDLQLSDIQMSLIMGFAFTFFYAVLGLPVARLVDRGVRKTIFSIGITIFSVMTLITGLASNFWHLFLARMGLGVGETTSGPSGYSLLSDYFPPQRLARAITGMQFGFVAGNAGALLIGGWLVATVGSTTHDLPLIGTVRGWQAVLMLISIPGFIVAALMLTVKEPPRRGARQEAAPIGEVFRLVLRNNLIYIPLFIGMGLRSAQSFGGQSWGAANFERTYDWGPAQYGQVAGFGLLIAMPLGLFLGNWLTEHFHKKGYHDAHMRVVVWSTVISVPMGIAYPLMPDPWLAAMLYLVQLMTSIMVAAPENAAIQTVTPNWLRGQMTFLFLFLMNVVGMGLGPLIVGAFSQYLFGEENIRYSLALMGVLMGIPAIYFFWRCMRPYGAVIATGRPVD